MPFPGQFEWGAATSAFQVEGGSVADGRGESIWDQFCRRPGAVFGGHNAGVACDHYSRFREDVALMRSIGLRAYRFSIAWPRVDPTGTGTINEAGLAFYDRLVDELLAAGINPWVTLYHWDLPAALQERAGWQDRSIADRFAEYTSAVVARLSDRVSRWITINEPQIFIGLGHLEGVHAPGLKLPVRERLLAAHHALLAHGKCCQAIRAHAKQKPTVGWAPIGRIRFPASSRPEDVDAARRATLSVLTPDFWNNTWFADPAILGKYPEDGLKLYGADAPNPRPGDMETIAQPLDFYGINVYDGEPYRAGPNGAPEKLSFNPGHPQSALRWFIAPEVLYWGPKFLFERYKVPIVVTENGLSNTDWIDADGRVRDPQRIDYTRQYLRQLRRAIDEGIDIRGYFHWSLLDNFEWQEGFKERFGLVHVDFQTQKRTPKASAAWYKRVIETNGQSLDETPGPI